MLFAMMPSAHKACHYIGMSCIFKNIFRVTPKFEFTGDDEMGCKCRSCFLMVEYPPEAAEHSAIARESFLGDLKVLITEQAVA